MSGRAKETKEAVNVPVLIIKVIVPWNLSFCTLAAKQCVLAPTNREQSHDVKIVAYLKKKFGVVVEDGSAGHKSHDETTEQTVLQRVLMFSDASMGENRLFRY